MTDFDPRSDGELLAATTADEDAFAAFYRRHVQAVIGFVSGRVAPDEVADVVAEVFATALVFRRRYDPARGDGGSWLTGIARNKLADVRRRGAVEVRMCRRLGIQLARHSGSEFEIDPDAELLVALPADQRRAVKARVLEDRPYPEIAREEAVSVQAVRKRVSRALAALRTRFEEESQ